MVFGQESRPAFQIRHQEYSFFNYITKAKQNCMQKQNLHKKGDEIRPQKLDIRFCQQLQSHKNDKLSQLPSGMLQVFYKMHPCTKQISCRCAV